MLCTCPNSQSLSTIPEQMCDESFGQIQKVAFQRLVDSEDGTRNGFASIDDLKSRLQWATYMVHYGDKRLVISPYIQAPTSEGGDARTFGGGNETLDGAVEILGANPTTFTGVLRSIPQTIIKMMKEFECEETIGVYLIDNRGQIGCIEENGAYYPIPIHSLFISDLVLGGYDAPDSNTITWKFKDGWSDNLAIVSLGWNALSDAPKVEVKEYDGNTTSYVHPLVRLAFITKPDGGVSAEFNDSIKTSVFYSEDVWIEYSGFDIEGDDIADFNVNACGTFDNFVDSGFITEDVIIKSAVTVNGNLIELGESFDSGMPDCFVDFRMPLNSISSDPQAAYDMLVQNPTITKVYYLYMGAETQDRVFYPLNFESKTHYLELTNEFGADFPKNTPPH